MSTKRNLLEELMGFVPEENKLTVVQSRASHVISSVIHLFEFIDQSFDEEEANELTKRLLLAIKNKDPQKFTRGVEALHEAKQLRRRKNDGKEKN